MGNVTTKTKSVKTKNSQVKRNDVDNKVKINNSASNQISIPVQTYGLFLLNNYCNEQFKIKTNYTDDITIKALEKLVISHLEKKYYPIKCQITQIYDWSFIKENIFYSSGNDVEYKKINERINNKL
eukprot:300111_1